jgi:hypothetical protein
MYVFIYLSIETELIELGGAKKETVTGIFIYIYMYTCINMYLYFMYVHICTDECMYIYAYTHI